VAKTTVRLSRVHMLQRRLLPISARTLVTRVVWMQTASAIAILDMVVLAVTSAHLPAKAMQTTMKGDLLVQEWQTNADASVRNLILELTVTSSLGCPKPPTLGSILTSTIILALLTRTASSQEISLHSLPLPILCGPSKKAGQKKLLLLSHCAATERTEKMCNSSSLAKSRSCTSSILAGTILAKTKVTRLTLSQLALSM